MATDHVLSVALVKWFLQPCEEKAPFNMARGEEVRLCVNALAVALTFSSPPFFAAGEHAINSERRNMHDAMIVLFILETFFQQL